MTLNKLFKVLIFSTPCLFFLNCSHKNNNNKIYELKHSNSKISHLFYRFDTLVDYYDFLGKNQISVVNNDGVILNFSIAKGLLIKINGRKLDTLKFTPFNHGKIESNIIHSEIVNDSIIYFFNNDALWNFDIKGYQFSKIYDLKNKIKSNKNYLFHIEQYTYNQSPSIKFHPSENEIYFPVYTHSKKEKKYFIGVFNLNNNRINILDLVRPQVDELIQQSIQDNTMYIINNNKIYFTFAFSKFSLIYDLKTKNIDTINLQSTFDTIPQEAYTKKNTKISSSHERLVKTILYNAYYQNFTFSSFKNHYYKLFYVKLEENNSNGLKNTFNDKKLVLQIFDKNLSLIKEFQFPTGFSHAYCVLPSRDGLTLFNGYNIENKILKLNINYD
jgi:hypothetical protein